MHKVQFELLSLGKSRHSGIHPALEEADPGVDSWVGNVAGSSAHDDPGGDTTCTVTAGCGAATVTL